MTDGPVRVALTAEQCWQPVPGGSGTYVVELGGELHRSPGATVTGIAARHSAGPPADWAVPFPVRHSRLPRAALYQAWNDLQRPLGESLVPEADVVHATTWAVPPSHRPLVVTVHDVAFLHDPSHFTRRGNAFFRRALDRVRRRADAIITPSTATADDCLRLGLPADRVHVVPHGMRTVDVTDADAARFRTAHGLDRPYVMWCGTIEPRKNLPTLLAAFAAVQDDLADLDLVLVGPAGWGDQSVAAPRTPAGRVRILGQLRRAELHAAYAGARAFCFPSLREGFGLPVLEAMSHAVPVVTSAATACAEVAGDAAILVDPLDVDALSQALLRATGSERSSLSAASARRAAQFSWSAAARRTEQVYRAVAGGAAA